MHLKVALGYIYVYFFSKSTHFLSTPVVKEQAEADYFRRGGAKIQSDSVMMQEQQKETATRPRETQRIPYF